MDQVLGSHHDMLHKKHFRIGIRAFILLLLAGQELLVDIYQLLADHSLDELLLGKLRDHRQVLLIQFLILVLVPQHIRIEHCIMIHIQRRTICKIHQHDLRQAAFIADGDRHHIILIQAA